MKIVFYSILIVSFSVSQALELNQIKIVWPQKRSKFDNRITRFNSFLQNQMSKVISLQDYDKNQLLHFLSNIEMK